MKDKLKIKTYHRFMALAVIIAVVFVNLITATLADKLPLKIDLTGNEVFQLSDETINVLKNVDRDVDVYYFVTSGNENLYVKQTVDMYKGYQSKIHFTEKDPAQDPAFTKSLGVEISDNSVVVKSGDRMKIVDASSLYDTTFQKQGIVSFELEARLTGAIEYVLKDEDINVLFTSGHEEVGMAFFQNILDKENATVSEIDLKSADIPEDTAVLYIIGPRRDFSSDEIAKIQSFVNDGGSLNISLDYGNDLPLLNQFMNEYYGISFDNNIIMETDNSHILMNNPFYIIPTPGEHDITKDFESKKLAVILPEVRSLTLSEKVGVESHILLSTSEGAVAKSGAAEIKPQVESGDVPAKYILGVAANVMGSTGKKARVVAVGSSLYAANMFLQEASAANSDFVINSYNYLHGGEITSFSITPKNVAVNYLTLNQGQIILYAIIFGILPPVLVLAMGVYVWFKRRRL